jgi:micrococcal nuclease
LSKLLQLKLKSELYHYAAKVVDVYDGDTLTVEMDLGLGVWKQGQVIRLWKVNAPEVRGAEREKGLAVRDAVREMLLERYVLVRTILDKRGADSTEKFGRLLGEILVETAGGALLNINQWLLDQGLAQPMDEDGRPVRAIAPVEMIPAPPTLPAICLYCGEVRTLETRSGVVSACPNCLDGSFVLRR